MERRTASHTEEEELNQRRRLLNLARKGDQKAINRLFELYQVRIYSGGDLLRKARSAAASVPIQDKAKSTPSKVASRHRRVAARRTAKAPRKVAHR